MSNYYKGNDLLTFEEFIEELAISESFGYRLLSSGTISGIKLGKNWRIPRQSIHDYITHELDNRSKKWGCRTVDGIHRPKRQLFCFDYETKALANPHLQGLLWYNGCDE